MTASRRVVITGYGATTPLGGDAASTWKAALAGTSGAGPLPPEFLERYDLPVHFACNLAVPTTEVLPRHEQKKLDPFSQMAVIAAREAWQHAGAPEIAPERLGSVIGTGIGGVSTLLSAYDTLNDRGAARVLPMTVPMLLCNMAAGAVSIEFGARAGAHCPVSACASGAEATGAAADMIRSDRADIVLAGGAEAAVQPLPIAGFAAMKALSTRNDSPQTASRPYDVSRDGFVIGEGSTVMVLEDLEHALARGATVYAEVAGVGVSSDAHHVAAPSPDGSGPAAAMTDALRQAGAEADEVVHVNAHATSTPAGDVTESWALHKVLGERAGEVPVSATKSMTGHLLGAAGALEGLFTMLALRDQTAPPTINLTEQDPKVELKVSSEPQPFSGDLALNNSFGFGGHNVAVAFRRYTA